MKTRTVLIHGFDRSGSTAITKALSSSPDIEIFMQPFNSGPIRERMYEIWNSEMASDKDKEFMIGLEKGILNREYIKSHWFETHSSATDFIEGKVHIIKSTINHFTSKWIKDDYPLVDQWAIWRDPMEILASLHRNNFIDEWYTDAVKQIENTVRSQDVLSGYVKYIAALDTNVKEAAFLIAVRTHYLLSNIDSDKIIRYSDFVKSPETALDPFCNYYNVAN